MKNYWFILLIFSILSLHSCSKTSKNTDWGFLATISAEFTPWHLENGVQYISFDSSMNKVVQYSIFVDVYYKYQDGLKYYAVKNQVGTLCLDEKWAFAEDLYIHNFRWNNQVGSLWINPFEKNK